MNNYFIMIGIIMFLGIVILGALIYFLLLLVKRKEKILNSASAFRREQLERKNENLMHQVTIFTKRQKDFEYEKRRLGEEFRNQLDELQNVFEKKINSSQLERKNSGYGMNVAKKLDLETIASKTYDGFLWNLESLNSNAINQAINYIILVTERELIRLSLPFDLIIAICKYHSENELSQMTQELEVFKTFFATERLEKQFLYFDDLESKKDFIQTNYSEKHSKETDEIIQILIEEYSYHEIIQFIEKLQEVVHLSFGKRALTIQIPNSQVKQQFSQAFEKSEIEARYHIEYEVAADLIYGVRVKSNIINQDYSMKQLFIEYVKDLEGKY